MGNAVFVNPPKTHTDPLRTCTDLQNCRQRFQGIWGVFSSKIAHLHRSWNAVFARYLRLFAGASCVSRGQKCATKTVVKLSSKLSSNEKLKPCDAVIARVSAIYFAGARGWTIKTLKCSKIKRFRDSQKTAKSRNDAHRGIQILSNVGTRNAIVVKYL